MAVTTGESALSPLWLIVAGLDGALLVVLGAAGVHGIEAGGDAEGLLETATQYHAWHALALAEYERTERHLVEMPQVRHGAGEVERIARLALRRRWRIRAPRFRIAGPFAAGPL